MHLPLRLTLTLPLTLLTLLSTTTASAAAAPPPTLPTSLTLAYTPLSASGKPATPKPFATLKLTPNLPPNLDPDNISNGNTTYTLSSYTPPKPPSSSTSEQSLARIGLLPTSNTAPGSSLNDGFAPPSTTLTRMDLLAAPEDAVLRVVLDERGAVVSVGLGMDYEHSEDVLGRRTDKTEKESNMPRLEIIPAVPEPRPVLNRPVVLDRDGKVPVQDKPEPSLLQKYWWVGAIALLLTLGTGGGGEEGGK